MPVVEAVATAAVVEDMAVVDAVKVEEMVDITVDTAAVVEVVEDMAVVDAVKVGEMVDITMDTAAVVEVVEDTAVVAVREEVVDMETVDLGTLEEEEPPKVAGGARF